MNNTGGREATFSRWADEVESALKPHVEGLTHGQVAALTGMSLSTTSKALTTAQKRGGALHVRTPSGALWWHYEHREIARKVHAELRAAARARSHTSPARAAQYEAAMSAFGKPVVHRIVKAHLCRPIGLVGPASVFQLGRAL